MSNNTLIDGNDVTENIVIDNLTSFDKKKRNRKKRKKRSKKENQNSNETEPNHPDSIDEPQKRQKQNDGAIQEKSMLPFLKNLSSLLVSDVEDITLPTNHNTKATEEAIDVEEGEIIKEQEDINVSHKKTHKKPAKKPKKPQEMPVCKRWIIGKCYKKDECPFLHQGEQLKSNEICKFYRTGSCSRGDSCLFSHDLKSEACKFLVTRGVCGKKEECSYSHDPELIQRAILMFAEKEKELKELEIHSHIPKEISNHLINFQPDSLAH